MFFGVLSMHQCIRLHTICFMFFAMWGNGHQTCNWPPPKKPQVQDGGTEPSRITKRHFSDMGWKHVHFWNVHHLISRHRFLKLQSAIHEDTCTKMFIVSQKHSNYL